MRGVLLAVAADAAPVGGVAEAAAGLGVLRARRGHDAAALVDDLLACARSWSWSPARRRPDSRRAWSGRCGPASAP